MTDWQQQDLIDGSTIILADNTRDNAFHPWILEGSVGKWIIFLGVSKYCQSSTILPPHAISIVKGFAWGMKHMIESWVVWRGAPFQLYHTTVNLFCVHEINVCASLRKSIIINSYTNATNRDCWVFVCMFANLGENWDRHLLFVSILSTVVFTGWKKVCLERVRGDGLHASRLRASAVGSLPVGEPPHVHCRMIVYVQCNTVPKCSSLIFRAATQQQLVTQPPHN